MRHVRGPRPSGRIARSSTTQLERGVFEAKIFAVARREICAAFRSHYADCARPSAIIPIARAEILPEYRAMRGPTALSRSGLGNSRKEMRR
jgi:hypothetical protein